MARPLYQEIADTLRERISSLGYRNQYGSEVYYSERLPSQGELEREFNTTHVTIGNAVQVLIAEGLVESHERRGYQVRREPELRFDITRNTLRDVLNSAPVDTWESDVAHLPHRQEIAVELVLGARRVNFHHTVSSLLEVGEQDVVTARRRQRFIGTDTAGPANRLESVHDSFYAPHVVARIPALNDPASINTARLLDEHGLAPRRFACEFGAPKVAPLLAERLRLKPATAVLERVVIAYTAKGAPVYAQHTLHAGNNTRIAMSIDYTRDDEQSPPPQERNR